MPVSEEAIGLIDQGRFDEALPHYEAALSADPDCPEAHFGIGQIHYLNRRVEQSLASFRRAWDLGVDLDRGAQERWMIFMLLGRFERAWQESDRVLRNRKNSGVDCRDWPLHFRFVWDGSPLAGKRVLIRCYHGLGDTIQFIRYAPLLKQIASRVTVQVQAELIPLLRSMGEIDELIPLAASTPEPRYDVDIESMELPHAFRTVPGTIPSTVPYLRVETPPRTSREFRVGLVWTAGAWRPERSVPLSEIATLADIPNVIMYSLQRGPAMRQSLFPDAGSDGILEAAQAIAGLDLVISVDTMIPHLAGALGKPVWTLLHYHSDWRWMLNRSDSPWYPTMRLFRQPAPGDWSSVIEQVKRALKSPR
ncbi:MAG: tetratricopeptide repeat-containing glycosyltransferase family protein [Acidobacteriota bacterium]|nr:tetratricopeptide repeat-containing glycosyltransferase family protein [Acidobacteriota bacterium]